MRKVKVALLASTTLDMLVGLSRAKALEFDLDIEWYVAPFSQYVKEILAPDSSSRKFHPEVVLLSIDCSTALNDPANFFSLVSEARAAYPSTAILIHTMVPTTPDTLSLMEWNDPGSRERSAAELNIQLSEFAGQDQFVRLLDLGQVVRRLGLNQVLSPRFHYLGKIPFNKVGLQAISDQFVTALNAIVGQRRKVIVLDLDGTLWGGVIGEDGIEGIKLSNDGEGRAFYDFQAQLLRLWESGVLLAICSKNDEASALHAIRSHPYMVLREECFAAYRINWEVKSDNIAELATELNLGLDSFVFLDDSPQERELVTSVLPMVVTPALPKDPSDYPTFLANLPYFETLSLSDEDRNRGRLYQQEFSRRSLAKSTISMDSYYRDLQIEVTVSKISAFDVPRIAQLSQRTNQFNANGRRYTQEEVDALSRDENRLVLTCSASDRFGDYGLIGVAILMKASPMVTVDTLLVSCRALGRGIEESFVNCLAEEVKHLGDSEMRIEYVSTDKNDVLRAFLSGIGFRLEGSCFVARLSSLPTAPTWIKLRFDLS